MFLFFFNDTATTEIYTLSLHDALPIWKAEVPSLDKEGWLRPLRKCREASLAGADGVVGSSHRLSEVERTTPARSEEHTSELQSQSNLVCRLLLEKKNILHAHIGCRELS